MLTTALGVLDSSRTGFVQDLTGGIAVYLDAALPAAIPAGTAVHVAGVVGSRYGERVLRAAAADVAVLGFAGLPTPFDVPTGAAGEALEGRRLRVTGLVTEAPAALTDGLGVTVDDGSGAVRLVVGPDALGGTPVATGMTVTAVGPLGQRDSTGTGASGYRLYTTLPGEFVSSPTPSPSASVPPSPAPTADATPAASESALPSGTPAPSASDSPEPTPSPVATASPSPTVSPAPTGTPSPTPSPSVLDISGARSLPAGSAVVVRGVVTAEAGRLGTPALFVIGDATGGLPVRLADGMSAPRRGVLVEVRGVIAAPYGQTELRLGRGGLTALGSAALPTPEVMAGARVGEAVEGRLVTVGGTITVGATRSTSGDMALVVKAADGTSIRVFADASSGLTASQLRLGTAAAFSGIVGQRASRKGALDGYRLWLRDRADVATASAPGASSSPAPAPTASPSPSTTAGTSPAVEPIATARVRDGATVTVQGVVTAGRSLLDASGRLAVLADGTGAIELYLPRPDPAVRLGARLRVTGVVGRAWGAPRLRVAAVAVLGTGPVSSVVLRVAPGASTEWQLARLTGTVTAVHRSGDRWVAELDTPSGAVPVIALAGASIPVSAIEKGRVATVTGIVKRPFPTASDRRYSVLPRRAADIVLGARAAAIGHTGPAAGVGGTGSTASTGAPDASLAPSARPAADLRDLAGHVGERVRVGGLVTEVTADGVRLDDGTATALVVLAGDAGDLARIVGPGDALDVTGTVELRDGPVVVVLDPTDVALAGDPGTVEPGDPTPAALLAVAEPDGAGPAAGVRATGPAAPEPVALAVALAAMVVLGVGTAVVARQVRARRRVRSVVRRRLDAWAAPAVAPAVETVPIDAG